MTQARGRSRQIGQLFVVENFELSVPHSFEDRVFYNTIMKAIPNVFTELTIDIGKRLEISSEDDIKDIKIDPWYIVDDTLIKAPELRVDSLPADR